MNAAIYSCFRLRALCAPCIAPMKTHYPNATALCLFVALCLACAARLQAQITVLTSFNGNNGMEPEGDLILSGSTLYGLTNTGGPPNSEGVVFSLPVGGGAPTILASFSASNGFPDSSQLLLSGGNLYCPAFETGQILSVPVGGGTFTVLATFNGTNGQRPSGNLTPSADGSILFGTTQQGGPVNQGVVYSLPAAGGTPTVLASFNGTNGSQPSAGLALSGSTLYGTTRFGGDGDGEIFSLAIGGGTPTVLAGFNGNNGSQPQSALTLFGGTLYGTTRQGGANGDGVVFSVPAGGGAITVLANFDGMHGLDPDGGLTLSADGNTLFGITRQGGANNDGEVFSLPIGGGTPTVLASFDGANGLQPYGGLTLSADGSTLYGTTTQGGANNDGVVFAVPAGVPEPGAAGFLVAGFSLVTLRRWRQRR
jgi:uncharacterized repeat protein (TIGR03803 family)